MKGLIPAATRLMPVMMLAFLTLATVQILLQLHVSPQHILSVMLGWLTQAGLVYAAVGTITGVLAFSGVIYEWRAAAAERKLAAGGRRRRKPRGWLMDVLARLTNRAALEDMLAKQDRVTIIDAGALAATLRGAEHLVEALGGESATLKSLGGHPETHILGESFYSQVPIRYGDYVAKVGLEPLTPALKALTGGKAELHDKPNGLREDVRRFIAANGGEWAFVVQLCVDTETMPIEQAHKPWPEEHSAYIQVARLVVPPQDSFDEFIEPRQDDALAFSPWRGLAAHQPLGSIMRVRRAVYEASAKFRLEHNGCPMHEPAGLATVGA